MSTIPARSRSLRKPSADGSRYERSATDIPAETARERSNMSPSRLPKPPSSMTGTASSSRSTNISRPVSSIGTSSGSTTRPISQRTGVSRPPLTSENKALSHRSGARTPTESNSSLQRAPSTRHSRNSSTSALPSRPSSSGGNQTRPQIFPSSASTLIRPPSSASTTSTHPDHKTSHRPAFSTLQQHFSPARSLAPKPATSLFLAPPSPSKQPAAIAASAETARLQAELLQLHLLHRSAASTYAQYQSSARIKLKARFDDVRAKHEELVELEAVEADKTNARALKAWSDGDHNYASAATATAVRGWGLEEKIRVLDQVLSAAWKLSEPGGRYARLVKRFERWLAGVNEILEARKCPSPSASSAVRGHQQLAAEHAAECIFIEELDSEWKAELQSLARKVEQWRVQLRDLGDVPAASSSSSSSSHVPGAGSSSSSLTRVLCGVRALVQGMCDEVCTMERLEIAVMLEEERWIREAIEEEEEDDDDGDGEGVSVAGAVWRRGR